MANGRVWTAAEDAILRATLHLHLPEVVGVLQENGYLRAESAVAHRRSRIGETGGFKRLAAGVKAERERIYYAGKNKPCKLCGQQRTASAMEYDHRPSLGVKLLDMAHVINDGHTVEAVLAEIAKCQVLCACCHRVVSRTREHRGNGPKLTPARPLSVKKFSLLWEFAIPREGTPRHVSATEFDIYTGYYQRNLASLLHGSLTEAYETYVMGTTWDYLYDTNSEID